MPAHAKVYISLVTAAGISAMAYALFTPPWSHDLSRFATYFVLSLLSAALKLRLPGLTGTMSIGFVFVLMGISVLTLPETMLLACAGVLVQCLWRARCRPTAVQVLFSMSAVAVSVWLASGCTQLVRAPGHVESVSIVMAVGTFVYFVSNSLLVSGVLSLVKQEPLQAVWQQCYLFAFPYYLLGGALVGLMTASSRDFGWRPSLWMLPVMVLAFLFYRTYLARFTVAKTGSA
jgi:hypothetical protein